MWFESWYIYVLSASWTCVCVCGVYICKLKTNIGNCLTEACVCFCLHVTTVISCNNDQTWLMTPPFLPGQSLCMYTTYPVLPNSYFPMQSQFKQTKSTTYENSSWLSTQEKNVAAVLAEMLANGLFPSANCARVCVRARACVCTGIWAGK